MCSLFLQHGSNPIHKNKDSKTAYELASDKSTRKIYRKFMAAFPDKYDYNKVNYLFNFRNRLFKYTFIGSFTWTIDRRTTRRIKRKEKS